MTTLMSPSPAVRSESMFDSPTTLPLRLEVLPASGRSQVEQRWTALERELNNRRLACSWTWTSTWLKHFGDVVPHEFVVALAGDKPCGIALLANGRHERTGPFALNVWHVGTAGEPDQDSAVIEYNTLLVEEARRCEFTSALFRRANALRGMDEFRLDGFVAKDVQSLIDEYPEAAVERKVSRYFDLAAVRSEQIEPIERLGSKTRANIRRSLRQLGQPRGEWAETPAQAELIWNELVRLHQARWTSLGKPGAYASKRFREFHLDLLHQLVPQGRMGLFRLVEGNTTLGCSQVLIDDNRALLYQMGWAPYSGDGSPGLTADYECIAECGRRGFDAFDFLAGDSDYKRRLSTNAAELVWATWRKPKLKYRVTNLMRTVVQTLRRRTEPTSATPTTEASNDAESIPATASPISQERVAVRK